MNRSIWTWIQAAISLCNAMFLVISHVPGAVTIGDTASRLVGQVGHHVLAKVSQGTVSAEVAPRRACELRPTPPRRQFTPENPGFVRVRLDSSDALDGSGCQRTVTATALHPRPGERS
jgi:hypothetical protein